MEQGTAILIDQIPLGILTFSNNGRVEFINQNFHKLGMMHRFNTSLLNINILKYNIFPPANIIEDLKEVLSGKSFEKEINNIKTSDEKIISLNIKGSPIIEGNNITGGMLIIENLRQLSETIEKITTSLKLTDEFINKEEIFLIVTDTNGDIKYSSGKENADLHLVRKEITGRNIGEILNGEAKEKILKSFNTAAEYGESQFLQIETKTENRVVKSDCTIEPVIGENGYVQIVYLLFKEIKESEELLLKSEKLNLLRYYEEINRQKETSFILIDNNGKVLTWDEKFGEISNLEPGGEILINDIFPTLDLGEFLKIIRSLDDYNSCELNTYLENKITGRFPVNLNFYKAKEIESTFIIVCTQLITDIPFIKQESSRTFETEDKIKDLQQPVCKINFAGEILFSNPAFNSMLEFQDVLLQGENLFELLLTDKPANLPQELSDLNPGERKTFQLKIRNRYNKKLDVNLIAEVANIATKNIPQNFYCFFTRNPESKLKSFESTYQIMLNTAQDAVAVELDRKIISANDSFIKLFGYETADEVINKDIMDLARNEDVPVVTRYFNLEKKLRESHERVEFFAKKKNGSLFYVEFYFLKIDKNQEPGAIFIARDTTERKRASEAASDSELKYKNIAENIDDILYKFERFNDKLLPSFYSSAVEKITGFTQIEFLNDPRLFLKIIHPDDFHDMKKSLSFLWKSDQQVTSEFEFRIINKSGNIVWVRNKVNVVRDSEGKIQQVYGLLSDITYSKRAEEELKQSAANLKKLNDAKDRFLSIISHDLRAPFSSILGFTDLLLEDDTLTETEKQQYITYIQDSSKSMLSLVNSMLEWTKLQTGRIKFEPEKINAKEIIDTSINTISGTALKKGVEIENLVDSSYHIFADKYLILMVFNNLLSNAVKFTKQGDRITLAVNTTPSARFINFSVKDTGIGIKKENLDKLFSIETKFTSEGTSGEKGSGLGLSLVKEIIEKHGGSIEVRSEYEKGTEFLFSLPVASTKILLVDPNKAERLFYSKVLINITTDYAVNIVSNGKEAFERIITSPPALVITEHKMPLMSGYDLVQELIKSGLKNTIPVIVLSSDIDRASIEAYKELGVEYIFNKPINLISLKDAIEKSLKKKNS